LAAHPIAHHGAADLTSDHEAGPRTGNPASTRLSSPWLALDVGVRERKMDHEPRTSRPSTQPHGGGEVGALAQPGRGRKHGNSRFRATSGRKALTALPTASGENGATGASAHAQPKAVGLCASAVVRLERALAHSRAPRKGPVRPGVQRRCGPQVRRNSYGTGPLVTRSNLVRRRSRHTRPSGHSPLRSNPSNCGERLEAQGGTLLASHGPDLIAVNRRSSDMMQSANGHSF
jgi:hypothetical protein